MVDPIDPDTLADLPAYRGMTPERRKAFAKVLSEHQDPDLVAASSSGHSTIKKEMDTTDIMNMLISQTQMQSFDNTEDTTKSLMNGMLAMAQIQNVEKESKNREAQNQISQRLSALQLFGKEVKASRIDPETRKSINMEGIVESVFQDKGKTFLKLSSGEFCQFEEIHSFSQPSSSLYENPLSILGMGIEFKGKEGKNFEGVPQEIRKTPQGVEILLDDGSYCNYNDILRVFPAEKLYQTS
jgi:hypothetical protein